MTMRLELGVPAPRKGASRRRYLEAGADISDDGRYRWRLWRRWADTGPALMIIGLNPSTADGECDDPTIVREVNFAERFGFSALMKLNLYAGRATRPGDLLAMSDPVGADNDAHLDVEAARHSRIVFAWGGHAPVARARAVALRVRDIGRRSGAGLAVLGWTSTNQPRHPLFLRADTPLQHFDPAASSHGGGGDPRWIALLRTAEL